jgi:release factor glutamine methyltransferase
VPTIQQTLRSAIAQLDAAGVDAPMTTARLLLAEALGVSKEWLVAYAASPLDRAAEQRFQHTLARVVAREPLAYVLGRRAFYGLDFIVDRRVLIPRPETEMLVDLALAALRANGGAGREWSVVDVGTGSGAVAVAVAKHAPAIRVLATDISAEVLAVARLNAQRHGVAERLAFVQADLLAGMRRGWSGVGAPAAGADRRSVGAWPSAPRGISGDRRVAGAGGAGRCAGAVAGGALRHP